MIEQLWWSPGIQPGSTHHKTVETGQVCAVQVYKFIFMYTEAQSVYIEECTKKKAALKGWRVAKLSVEK